MGLMEGLEHHLTCSPRPHAPPLSRFVLSAQLITVAVDPHILFIATATLQSPSPLPEVHRYMTVKDSVHCLFLLLNLVIYPTPPNRVTLGFAFTHHPTACMAITSPRHHASLPALKKWPPLPVPIIRPLSLAHLPVGL